MSSLVLLLEESTTSSDIITIEATVATGFEYVALEECKEKLGKSTKSAIGRGRIFFNISSCNIRSIDDLRSVDHLYVVINQRTSLGLTKSDMDESIIILQKLVIHEEVCKAVSVWRKKTNFKGIIYPSQEQYILAKDAESELKLQAKTIAENKMSYEIEECSENSKESKLKLSDRERRTKLNAFQVAAYHELDSRCPEKKVLKYRVTCERNGKHCFSSETAAHHVGGTLQDMFNWVVDLKLFDVEFVLNIREDSMYYGIALTSESKHHRNITAFCPTTLRATICYNMLRLAKPKCGDIIIDPMCGGGSIPIEGLSAFPESFYICGDICEKAVTQLETNIENLNLNVRTNHIDAFIWDTTSLSLRDSSVDIFITDLPFGKRCGSSYDNRTLYKKVLVELARVVRCKSGQAVLLTYDTRSMRTALVYAAALWSLKLKHKVNIGGLEAHIFLLSRRNTASSMPPPAAKGRQARRIKRKLINKS